MKKYKTTNRRFLCDADAQLIGEAFDRAGGKMSARQLVQMARPRNSPLHHLIFRDDDASCAEKYRLSLARNYINHIEIVFIENKAARSTKAFHSVEFTDGAESVRSYCSFERITDDKSLNDQVVANALRELTYWQSKYAEYRRYPELRGVFSAIQRVAKKPYRRRLARSR